jgi:hypothetical protein
MEQLPSDKSTTNSGDEMRPGITAVDKLADTLVDAYDNSQYRTWYCRIIYELGVKKVEELHERAKAGREPKKLFSALVREARQIEARSKFDYGIVDPFFK